MPARDFGGVMQFATYGAENSFVSFFTFARFTDLALTIKAYCRSYHTHSRDPLIADSDGTPIQPFPVEGKGSTRSAFGPGGRAFTSRQSCLFFSLTRSDSTTSKTYQILVVIRFIYKTADARVTDLGAVSSTKGKRQVELKGSGVYDPNTVTADGKSPLWRRFYCRC